MKTIDVTVSPDGSEVVMEVNGVKGSSCQDLTDQITNALGTVTKTWVTEEYYQQPISNEVEIDGS
jgi:hypothetical protein